MTEKEARNMKLSEHFTLWEFLRSDKATELGLMQKQLNVSDEIVNNLRALCVNVLEPLRLAVGTVIISSGYRCPELNEAINGSKNSQHMKGEAADIIHPMAGGNRLMYKWIRANVIYDQLINEHNYTWIHVSFTTRRKNRQHAFKTI